MEMNPEMRVYLEKLEKSNRQQVRAARLQCFFSFLAAVCCLLLLLTVAKIVPDIKELSNEIGDITMQAESVLSNLDTVTQELAAADLERLVSDVNVLVTDVDGMVASSQEGVEDALEKMNAIDIDTLNKAISDLAKIVEPLARLFGR